MIFSAFRVHFSTSTFPNIVVTASTVSSGEKSAMRKAQ